MQRTARSMTLLLALVLSLGACVPRPHVAGYQLDTELPQGLPDQAPIYHVVESLTPAASLCGYHDWIKQDTYYETYYGTVNISGWFEVPTWCDPAKVCRAYHSDTDYYLYCAACTGRFKSSTWFTNRCFPNMGPKHTTSVSF